METKWKTLPARRAGKSKKLPARAKICLPDLADKCWYMFWISKFYININITPVSAVAASKILRSRFLKAQSLYLLIKSYLPGRAGKFEKLSARVKILPAPGRRLFPTLSKIFCLLAFNKKKERKNRSWRDLKHGSTEQSTIEMSLHACSNHGKFTHKHTHYKFQAAMIHSDERTQAQQKGLLVTEFIQVAIMPSYPRCTNWLSLQRATPLFTNSRLRKNI